MKTLIGVITGISLILSSCSGPHVKLMPSYRDLDPKMQNITDEYLWLSRQNNIAFYNKVTAGFTHFKEDLIVGMCTYGSFFREIDVDIDYWLNSTPTTRMALLYHELTHCYCTRGHDYGEGLKYPDSRAERLFIATEWKIKGGPRPGYWADGCPISLMYPEVVDDGCMRSHYQQYVTEMFNRCKSW